MYVDDLLLTRSSDAAVREFKFQMSKHFEISDMGLLSYYLGIEAAQSSGKTMLKQSAYAKKILEKASM